VEIGSVEESAVGWSLVGGVRRDVEGEKRLGEEGRSEGKEESGVEERKRAGKK